MLTLFFLMVIGGMGLLTASLPSIRSILRTLSSGYLHTRWKWLQRLILGFLAGYAAFGISHLGTTTTRADLIVAMILLAGGGFVLIVAQLSSMTTSDIVRIASLERDIMRDPMTGAYNRRYLERKLDEEIKSAQDTDSPLSALMVDLDHFKHINDNYGHTVGDQVLCHISSLIIRQVRASDTVVRYGGEEFLILAPNSSLQDASCLGEQVLENIRSHRIPLPNGEKLPVTASLGVAVLDGKETRSAFLRRSDEALYQAKRSGRDKMCVAHSRVTAAA